MFSHRFSFLPALALLGLFTVARPAHAADIAKPVDSENAEGNDKSDGGGGSKKTLKVSIEMRDGLRFEPPRFAAQPGQEVIVSLENTDSTHQPHNFLVLQPGKREEVVQQALALGEKGPAIDYIPENPSIIVHSSLLNAEGKNQVKFTLPKEKGIYPYVCTMPGHGLVMYGAIYAGVKMPSLAKDENIPPQAAQGAIAGSGQRPFIQRVFLPNTGPASIAVALPGDLNYCWDAGECRLRYVWRGAFIDASANWHGSGRDLAVVPADPWWSTGPGSFPLKIGASSGPPAVKFLGYKIEEGIPEFHYRVGAAEVFEKITSLPDNSGISEHFRMPKVTQPVQYVAAAGSASIKVNGTPATPDGVVKLAKPADFTITITAPTAGASPAKQ